MFSSVLTKRLPAEAGISVVCVSPGIVHTNVVSLFELYFYYCMVIKEVLEISQKQEVMVSFGERNNQLLHSVSNRLYVIMP